MTLQYSELKSRLDTEMNTAAQSFIRIGYLLRLARDTDVLAGSGYTDVAEFAKAEYGLDRSQVSRFIRINERFGNGAALQEQYEGFGSSKLSEMLMLPDSVAEELPWEASKSEIRALANDLAEDEKKTSDLEIAMEEHSEESIWLQAFREYFHLRPAEYVMLAERMAEGYPTIALMDVMAPNGIALKTIRLPGIGKVTISFRGNRPVSLLQVRSGDREEKEVGLLAEELQVFFAQVKDLSARGAWSMLYQEPFPQDEEENIREPEPSAQEQKEPEKKAAPADSKAGKPDEDVAPAQQDSEHEENAPEEPEKAEEKPEPAKKAPEPPKSAPKKQKVVDIVKPKKKDPEPKQRAEAEPEKAPAKTSGTPAPDIMNPPEPEKENAQIAQIAQESDQTTPENAQIAPEPESVQDNPEDAREDPESAQPVTIHDVILGEIRRCYRLLGESIDEAKWARARGFLSKLREYVDRIEVQEEEEDKAQMSFEDFPELMPEEAR